MAAHNYETVFIAEPEIPTDKVEQLVTKLKQIVTDNGGVPAAEDRWGRRRLAYPIQGHREGFYSVLTFSGEPTVVAALEHVFNVTDSVLRHMTIKVIKKTKKFAPRRERPAGAVDGPRGTGRPGSSRPRVEYARPASTTGAPAAAVAPATPATPAAQAAPKEPTEGGNAGVTPTTLRLVQLNDVRLVGRLTRDPEVRYTPKGVAVARLDLAVNRRYKDGTGEWREEATFVPVTVWRETAERCRERLKKGSPLYVEGRLRSTSWETKDGQKRSGLEVEAFRLQFLAKTGTDDTADASEGGGSEAEPASAPVAATVSEPMSSASASGDDEIPF